MDSKKPGYMTAWMMIFGHNWLTLLGGVIGGFSTVLMFGLGIMSLTESASSPYLGVVAYMVLPNFLVLGLGFVIIGILWARRRRHKGQPDSQLVIDFNSPNTRRAALTCFIITAFTLFVMAIVTYEGAVYVDSVPFCGKVCHTVMEPEYTAYSLSPHLRVKCVECHVGPGMQGFVESKLAGLKQVAAVALNTCPRPIESPVTTLRPARDTCEHCHWPEKFTGDRLKVITKFQDDETNSPLKTVLLLHIGGGGTGQKGIHSWHISPKHQTYYTPADRKRQSIARVRVVNNDGTEFTFKTPEDKFTPEQLKDAKERRMDCIDCHNRPSHIFKLPATEMDLSMAAGRINPKIPYIKKLGVETLTDAKGGEHDLQQISDKVSAFYNEKYPDFLKENKAMVDSAIAEIQAIYKRNVFPKMNLTWGVHPNNLGHELFPGCFRCHDDSMQSSDGKSVGQDCTICHTVLAWDEADPEILQKLGQQ
ncbi:MAG TPA: NapC/NirT family cytochrome c [Candidatus Hydrogenedentes bacterium]|nr:NapC/NirT family cytochrome c [Candidatus Hydrogenedentota bacterium]